MRINEWVGNAWANLASVDTFAILPAHGLQNLVFFHLQGPLSERLPWPAYFKPQAIPQAVISKPLLFFFLTVFSSVFATGKQTLEKHLCSPCLTRFITDEGPDFCLFCLQNIELGLAHNRHSTRITWKSRNGHRGQPRPARCSLGSKFCASAPCHRK